MTNHTSAIVLAGGKGTRMNSVDRNKVTVSLKGRPMISYTIEHLKQAQVKDIVVVVGFQADSVKQALGDSVTYATQTEQLGTGHAIATALPFVQDSTITILAVSGDDSSFYPPSLYRDMISTQQSTQADVLVLTIHKDDPTGLGRIVRNQQGQVIKIVEEKNATPTEKKLTEINTGFYCFSKSFLTQYIPQIKPNPITKEYYATDLVEIALKAGKKVTTVTKDSSVWHGVNTPKDYEQAKLKVLNQEL